MNPLSRYSWVCLVVLAAALPARAESFTADKKKPYTADRIDFEVDLQPADPFSDANKVGAPRDFRRGEVLRLVVQGAPRKGFHTYPLTKQVEGGESNISHIQFVENPDLQFLWPTAETAPELVDEGSAGVYLEHEKPFTWTQEIYVKPDAKPGPERLHFKIHLTVCDTSCVIGDHEFDVPFTVIDSPVVPPPAELAKRVEFTPPPAETVSFKGKSVRVVALAPPVVKQPARADAPAPQAAEPVEVTPAVAAAPAPLGFWGLLGFMGQGVLWGALSLITPCVFPMIPITVSYFLKQSEKSTSPGRAHGGRSPMLFAAVYSATIAVVLTVAGVTLIRIVQPFSQHWATNLVLGGLFVFFALSLFGMYDIVLPSGLGRMTAAGEGRGGLVGVVFMALTFTVISFACVAPFYGGFIALSAAAASAEDWLKLVLGALAFSVTFALPFFVLALFPFLLKKLPKSGSWLNTVKVVMGFLELAACFKFLRAAELNFLGKTEFLTYDLVLGVYIALALACGLYLLGVYRLPHDHGAPEALSVPRLLFSVAFLGLGLYLLPGLFKTTVDDRQQQQRPGGAVFAWLDAFLLPERSDSGWKGDLQAGLKEAAETNRLVFIDFTAETCTNCKLNEGDVFPRPEINDLLKKYVRVRLYTDRVPKDLKASTTGEDNLNLLHDKFGTGQLPLYAILRPKDDGGYDVLSTYVEGKISNVPGFAQFLEDPLKGLGPDARAQVN